MSSVAFSESHSLFGLPRVQNYCGPECLQQAGADARSCTHGCAKTAPGNSPRQDSVSAIRLRADPVSSWTHLLLPHPTQRVSCLPFLDRDWYAVVSLQRPWYSKYPCHKGHPLSSAALSCLPRVICQASSKPQPKAEGSAWDRGRDRSGVNTGKLPCLAFCRENQCMDRASPQTQHWVPGPRRLQCGGCGDYRAGGKGTELYPVTQPCPWSLPESDGMGSSLH